MAVFIPRLFLHDFDTFCCCASVVRIWCRNVWCQFFYVYSLDWYFIALLLPFRRKKIVFSLLVPQKYFFRFFLCRNFLRLCFFFTKENLLRSSNTVELENCIPCYFCSYLLWSQIRTTTNEKKKTFTKIVNAFVYIQNFHHKSEHPVLENIFVTLYILSLLFDGKKILPNIYTHKNKQSGKITGMDVTIFQSLYDFSFRFAVYLSCSVHGFLVQKTKCVMSNVGFGKKSAELDKLESIECCTEHTWFGTHQKIRSSFFFLLFDRFVKNCSVEKSSKITSQFVFCKDSNQVNEWNENKSKESSMCCFIVSITHTHQFIIISNGFSSSYSFSSVVDFLIQWKLLKWLQWFEYMNDCRVQITALSNN